MTQVSQQQKTDANRAKAREEILERIASWYVQTSNMLPVEIVRVPRPYRGQVEYYLEPELPGEQNPVAVEMFIGDSWTMGIAYRIPGQQRFYT